MYHKLIVLFAVILWSAMTLPLQKEASAQTALNRAVVQNIRNLVRLIPRNLTARPARVSDAMKPGDALSTGRSSLAELRFNDGSLARIGEQAVFRFLAKTRNFDLSNGTVLLLIPPGRGTTSLRTPNAAAAIRGSALFVRYIPNTNTTIIGSLTDSNIEVSNEGGSQTQVLEAGQMAVVVEDRIEQLYEFDLNTFYETSDLVQELDLKQPPEQASSDPAIASVQAETSQAAAEQKPLTGEGVIENPAFVQPAATPTNPPADNNTTSPTPANPPANNTSPTPADNNTTSPTPANPPVNPPSDESPVKVPVDPVNTPPVEDPLVNPSGDTPTTPTDNIPTTPTDNTPTDNTPTTPTDNTPTDNTPTTPTDNTPTDNTPTDNTPTTPTDNTPTDNTPTDNTPTTPTDNTPTDNTPTDNTPTDNTPTDNTPTDNTPTDNTPTTPTDNTPTDSTPTDNTPTTPTDNTPTTPTDNTPTAPTDDTPTDNTPTDNTPTDNTPTDNTPTAPTDDNAVQPSDNPPVDTPTTSTDDTHVFEHFSSIAYQSLFKRR